MSEIAVLIVDDAAEARTTARQAVALASESRAAPLITLEASSGEECVRMLRTRGETVRVVVLDLNFPGDMDGRLVGPLIRAEFPTTQIIPFTADRQAADPHHWQTFGLPEPLLKPCAPEALAQRITAALDQPVGAPPSPVQAVLVDQARQMVQLIQRTRLANGAMQVGVLARTHLEQAGLAFVLGEVRQELPLEIAVASADADAVRRFSQGHRLDVLLAVPQLSEAARRVAAAQGLPLLIYASVEDARRVLAEKDLSVVVGRTTPNEMITAFLAVLNGERYRHPQIMGVLSLTVRQRQIIARLLDGASTEQIANEVGLSAERVRHVFAELYKQLRLPPTRPALLAWARVAPLHLLTPDQE